MRPSQTIALRLEVDLEPLQLLGKEREQYEALEQLREISFGKSSDVAGGVTKIRAVMADWDRMLGGQPILSKACEKYLTRVEIGEVLAGRPLYLLASPMIFYIHALYQVTKKTWRSAIVSCGIFCERIVRNLALYLDLHVPLHDSPISEIRLFADKNGKVKHRLEELGIHGADDLFHLLKRMYSARSAMGPHDVPPPEPREAKINVTLCLPLYMDYLRALSQLDAVESREGEPFESFMDQASRVHIQLAFGDEVQHIPASSVIRDRLYRMTYFAQERSLSEVATRFREEGYSFSDSVLAHALRKASTGKSAILTRAIVNGKYVYRERLPPGEYFRTLI